MDRIESRSIYSPATGFIRRGGFDWTCNPYVGCTFGCTYCYAAFLPQNRRPVADWGRWLTAKSNAVELATRHAKKVAGAAVYMSSVTDPYQPAERSLFLTRGILEALIAHQPRLVVQTRGSLVVRDIDLLRGLRHVRVNLSIPTDSDEVRSAFEPKAPPLVRRWAAAEELKASGVPVGLCVTPTLPLADPDAFAARLAEFAPAVLVCQDFHDSGGGFGADTGATARELLAKTGWSAERYRRFVTTLRERYPTYEGEAGFFPPGERPALFRRVFPPSRRSVMPRLSPTGQRKVIGLGMLLTAVAVGYWTFFSDGLPIWRGPTASAAEVAAGRELFEREWSPNDPMAHGDGLGPVFNARSCAACHFQGGLGGGGGNEHNAVGFEVLPRPGDHSFIAGTIHNFSTNPAFRETISRLNQLHPTIPGSTTVTGTPDCQRTVTIPDFNPVRTQPVQATALFGAGWIDLISDRAILRNARNRGVRTAVRELSLHFDDIPVGKVRQVAGGVGKFGWRGQFHTLADFVSAACANELGLGTPDHPQPRPYTQPGEAAAPDLDRTQVRQLVAFVKTLPRPVQAEGGEHAARGKQLFGEIGCAACHVPDLGGVAGVYSDFLLYVMEDPVPSGRGGGSYDPAPPELKLPGRPSSETEPNEWKTPPLWGVADSAPYWHDGTAATLKDAILKHRGNGKAVSERYKQLPAADQAAVLAFLGTLKGPPDAQPLRNSAVIRLARK